MAKQWRYFLFLLWISYLTVASILLFASGFLLNRITLNHTSTCVLHSELPCKHLKHNCSQEEVLDFALRNRVQVCQPRKARVVLLIIDALRYDFALYDRNLTNSLPYQNKLPIISELLKSHPETTRLYKFVADPPTTTTQRLKALTTGSLPTFIDAGSNFATSVIGEDNIIDQLVRQNHTVVFLGDDTWEGLYPGRFARSYPFPSFNVWDLDKVDAGVSSKIFDELQMKDWSLLIGHYLGVDHCGHRYGPNHLEMARKLAEMDEVIRKLTRLLDDDVVLFVVGDHGMTKTGDHGGESLSEVISAMFVYSKLPLLSQATKTVKQVDLIPTLSAILGVPIPFANLGSAILSCLPGLQYDWHELQLIAWTNFQQVFTYITEYSNIASVFEEAALLDLDRKYNLMRGRLPSPERTSEIFKVLGEYREMCEEVWVQFDSFSMTRGLIFTFLSLFLLYTIADGIPNNRQSKIFTGSCVTYLYLSLLVSVLINFTCYALKLTANFFTNLFFMTGITSIFMLSALVLLNWDVIALNWHEANKKRGWVEFLCRMILLLSFCGFFSNSFVVEDAYVTLFLLVTLIGVVLLDLLQRNTSRRSVKTKLMVFSVVFCILIRMSMCFWRCREENNCINQENQSKSRRIFDWGLALISLALLVTLARMCLRSCGNLSGFSFTTILARFAPTTIVVCTLGFWVLHDLPNYIRHKLEVGYWWQTNVLAWIVYFLIITGIFLVYIQPLSLWVLPINLECTIPRLFKQVKSLLDRKGDENEELPAVCGLGTAYSAIFTIVSIYIVLLLALLLGDAAAPSAVLMYFALAIVSAVTSISRFEKSSNIGHLLEVPMMSLLLWVMLARYFFYGTGHQATFPDIVWEAAFVGIDGEFGCILIPATLVLLNTFGSYILVGFMLPFLQIAPFSLYVTFTSLASNRKLDMSRGDILLHDNDSLLFDGAFVLSCKYFSCHLVHVFASMMSATIHCRHLMVWKIFAPRFIFEAIALFVSIPSVLLGYLLLVRVNGEVHRLVKSFSKRVR